jgi:hypothetical protein
MRKVVRGRSGVVGATGRAVRRSHAHYVGVWPVESERLSPFGPESERQRLLRYIANRQLVARTNRARVSQTWRRQRMNDLRATAVGFGLIMTAVVLAAYVMSGMLDAVSAYLRTLLP